MLNQQNLLGNRSLIESSAAGGSASARDSDAQTTC